jgi:electron transport complex protein RnfC
MLFRRYGMFTGGIDLPDEKDQTLTRPIEPAPPLERLRVPLAPCGGGPARLLVKVGDFVSAGQRLADPDGPDGVPLFAPLSARVAGLTTAEVVSADGFVSSPAVDLTDLSQPRGIQDLTPTFEWRAASGQALREKIADGGLLQAHRARPLRPLARWIDRAVTRKCRALLLNAMEHQPRVTSDHRLLVEHGPEVIRGLTILAQAMELEKTALAVDQRRTDDYRELLGPARLYKVNRVALPHKYPMGADPILVKVLTRREVPPGGGTMDVGVAVTDAATCFAVYRWVACGLPPTARVVTVAGDRLSRFGNFWTPLGGECLALAPEADGAVIHGGPMSGLRCGKGAVVTAATSALLAIGADMPPTPTPCIRCGWCTDHCPARLNVAALNDAFELGQVAAAEKAGVLASVECGLCSYVCPARLPLSQRVKQLKRAVRLAQAGRREKKDG